MNAATTASLALSLALASGQANAEGARPLQLDFVAPARRTLPVESPRRLAMVGAERAPMLAPAFRRVPRSPIAHARAQQLGEQALETVLDPATPRALDEERSEGDMQLKFHKGGGFRDLNRSYREMCDRVSQKVWDDPNGKRLRFDVAGKPGIGIEIPVGHRRAR